MDSVPIFYIFILFHLLPYPIGLLRWYPCLTVLAVHTTVVLCCIWRHASAAGISPGWGKKHSEAQTVEAVAFHFGG